MSKKVEIVWRQIKSKSFRGAKREEKAKAFVKKLGDKDEEVQVFEVDRDSTTAYFDPKTFKRTEMDG